MFPYQQGMSAWLLALFFSLLMVFKTNASPRIPVEVFIHDPARTHLTALKQSGDFVFDHFDQHGYELYGPQGLEDWLTANGIPFTAREKNLKEWDNYPSPADISQRLQELALQYPHIMQLESIGESVQGRPLWMVKISDNPQSDEREPEVKYIANMHGDEILGREFMVFLIEDLLKKYSSDHDIKSLIDNTEIFIMPSMNPDGARAQRRSNGNYADLNRNFPDFTTSDNQNNPTGREPETVAIMEWQKNRKIALSANFHGGAVCVNYPWDTAADPFPLHDLIVKISKDYARKVPEMVQSRQFPGGITNGHAWYEVNGGMQDWSYYWHDDMQVTIELSNRKWPSYSEVRPAYQRNFTSLIEYLKTVHQGVGFTTRENQSGKVTISQGQKMIGKFPYSAGEFYKVLPPGQYQLKITADSGASVNMTTMVSHTIQTNGNFIEITW